MISSYGALLHVDTILFYNNSDLSLSANSSCTTMIYHHASQSDTHPKTEYLFEETETSAPAVHCRRSRGRFRRVTSEDHGRGSLTALERSDLRWKPLSLRAPFLVFVILISIILIVILGILFKQSQTNGGVLFAPDINNLPLVHSFAYLYLPTLISVLYSILWAWIDLDVKRLEPYHQLSKPEGALAEDSLLLHYPFDFIAAVPIKALRRR